jgi:glycosyltransferase involved in cell wall biosynthesis
MLNLKVVQVGWNWINELGGAAQSVSNFQKALGSFVVSFTKENGGLYRGSENVKQLHIPYADCNINRYSYSRSPLKEQAEQVLIEADLIVCHGFYRYHFDWAVKIAKQHNIPYWIIPHGSLDPYVFTYRALSKKIWFALKGNKSFADASALIFATESEREKAQIYAAVDRSHVIHWPVEYVYTDNRETIKTKIRKKLNIPAEAKVLIYIGRFHPMKRPIDTISAVAACKNNNLYLIMIGPDSDVLTAAECKKYCQDNDIANVCFVKAVYGQEKFDYYLAVDAFISLSHRENFGYTVAEALSSGIPVILSPGNDLGNDIKLLGCGWLLEDNSLRIATKAVSEFASTPRKQLADMGLRGQEWARSELSWLSFNSKIQKLVQLTAVK